MPHRRKPPHLVSPAYEDNGLFKAPVRKVTVALVPQIARNNRQDVVVRGFVEPNIEVSVIFAGRRAKMVAPLEAQLRRRLFRAKASVTQWDQAALDSATLLVSIEGSWRPRFERDPAGWETRSYHLMAARWALIDAAGMTQMGGEGPVRSSAPRETV